jgi:hypothetical protein
MSNRNYPKVSTATTVIPFDNPVTAIPQKTITGATTFTKTTTGAQAGYCAIIRVIANGTNTPDLSAFKSIGTGVWDNTNGVVNQLWFVYDGTDCCVSITHPVAIGGGGGGDTTPPSIVTVSVEAAEPNVVFLAYGETLDSASVPATSAYTVKVNGTTRTLSAVAITGANVKVTFGGAAVITSDTVTLDYVVPGTNPVQDAAGNDAAALTGVIAGNNVGGGGTFTSTNRVAFYTNSSKTVSSTNVTKWANTDGNTAKDYSLSDGVYPQDGGANGLTFDGTANPKLYMATVPTNQSAPVTIYMRVKLNAFPSALFAPSGSAYGLFFDTAHTYFNPAGSGYGDVAAGVGSGSFHTVVITWDGTNPNKVYVDGTLLGTATGAPSGTALDYGILASQSPGTYFNGNILGLAIFSAVHDATTVGTQTSLFNTAVA